MPPLSLTSSASLPQPSLVPANWRENQRRLSTIRNLVESTVRISPPTIKSPPVESLRRGDWIKLICGASFEDVADIRNLSFVYTLAGVDCIDCAADASVVNAVRDGIEAAVSIAHVLRPWVMISINDDREDVHFRKAEFDPEDCPIDCSRPCEMVCPANAISFETSPEGDELACHSSKWGKFQGGVITERCYGCGRCFPVCPFDKIKAVTYVRDPAATSEILKRDDVDAVEIHTRGRRTDVFNDLWNSLGESVGHVKLVAVSLPDVGESTVGVMNMIYSIMEARLQCHNLWQLDGRPMSGDIGQGATKKAVDFAIRLAATQYKPPGFYQLAGGTNSHTIDCLKKVGLFQAMTVSVNSDASKQSLIGGIAYGGYARKVVGRVLQRLPTRNGHARIEDYPEQLLDALREALTLTAPVKCYALPSVWSPQGFLL